MKSVSRIIYQAQRAMDKKVSHDLNHKSITMQQFMMLEVIHENPRLGLGKLSDMINLDRTSFSRNVLLLLKNGWVARTHNADPRIQNYILTPQGILKLEAAKIIVEKIEAEIIKSLTPEISEQLTNYLNKFIHS